MRWDTYERIWNATMVALIIVSVVVSYLVLLPLKCGEDNKEELKERLMLLNLELLSLKQQHIALSERWRYAKRTKPDVEAEGLKRTIFSNTKELWNYLSNQLKPGGDGSVSVEKIRETLDETLLRKRILLSDLEKLQNADAWSEWREREATRVSKLVQGRLRRLQNPKNCLEAKKLYCNLDRNCDFGCRLHHVVYCLIFAYATERTLIFMPVKKTEKKIFPAMFPISSTCNMNDEYDRIVRWDGDNSPKAVEVDFKPLEKFLPLSVPEDLGHRVKKFNGDPAAWWVGQMVRFVMKPQPDMQAAISKTTEEINFSTPIVGIHVRRTDKVGTEASFHHIEEYMTHVQEYYDQLELTTFVEARRVYVATDDVDVLEEVRKKYPQYQFFGNRSTAELAAPRHRGLRSSVTGLLVDLNMLSKCDYVVGTFSSQISRAVYEMMQANKVDASNSFHSLDDIYFFDRQNKHYRVAVISNSPGNKEMKLQKGDLIAVAGNHWNGYGLGTNNRTGERGMFPWYKTSDVNVMEPFPKSIAGNFWIKALGSIKRALKNKLCF